MGRYTNPASFLLPVLLYGIVLVTIFYVPHLHVLLNGGSVRLTFGNFVWYLGLRDSVSRQFYLTFHSFSSSDCISY